MKKRLPLPSGSGKLAQARTTTRETITQNTGNLVVASFRHETSRALDPELHTHAFVMNMTQRGMVNGGRLKTMN